MSDEAVTAVARHTQALSSSFRVACMDWPVVESFIDKRRTYEVARSIGVPAPRTLLPRDAADVERCGQEVGYPCLLKPSHAHLYRSRFKRKLVKVAGPEELLEAWTEAEDAGLGSMVQEFIPGPDTHGATTTPTSSTAGPWSRARPRRCGFSPPRSGTRGSF